jgi:glucoside 3-dehydrogenase (cytochrome c) hitch-hiker subunit
MSTLETQTQSPELLRRRELLKRAAWLLGGAVSAPAALAILQGCSAKEAPAAAPVALKVLNAAQLAVLAEIAETMVPKTTTSGAKDAGVPAFIDQVLDAVYPKEAQERFVKGLDDFEAEAKAADRSFVDRDPADRAAFLKQHLEAALAGERDPKPFILMARELTLLGFFTSQPGITENMTYEAVPTVYHGCVPLSKMAKHVYWE